MLRLQCASMYAKRIPAIHPINDADLVYQIKGNAEVEIYRRRLLETLARRRAMAFAPAFFRATNHTPSPSNGYLPPPPILNLANQRPPARWPYSQPCYLHNLIVTLPHYLR